MKKVRIIVGATSLIGLFLIGLTIQAKTVSYFKNLWLPSSTMKTTNVDNQEQVVQLALLLDTSGSMNGLIEQAKSQLWKIVNELGQLQKNGKTPTIEIALFEYGTELRANGNTGWVREISNFTRDMDKISGELFALTTGGGNEYCGLVLKNALDYLSWNRNENSLRLLYIAGNETFDQGVVDYREIASRAKSEGVFVNTIFCGNQKEGINLQWQTAASLGGGDYASIDHNQTTVYIQTPYDQQISNLNSQLNDTYVAYGAKGEIFAQNQQLQDNNAGKYSQANVAERAIYKSSKNYSNEQWDLVDAYKKDKNILKNTQNLSADWKQKSLEEREATIQKQIEKRANINNKIQQLNHKRQAYLNKKALDNNAVHSLEKSISNSIKKQAKAKGFGATFPNLSIETLGQSKVDYSTFISLTNEVEAYRKERMLDFADFLELTKDPNTLILDTRSKKAYEAKHLKGAVHLNFSDFTAEKLAKLIPTKDTPILIYCNNNFYKGAIHFPSKLPPLALNIPTYINLYGYGYQNVYELAAYVSVDHKALEFEGTFK